MSNGRESVAGRPQTNDCAYMSKKPSPLRELGFLQFLSRSSQGNDIAAAGSRSERLSPL